MYFNLKLLLSLNLNRVLNITKNSSRGNSEEKITHNLDTISNLKLYHKLHNKEGKSIEIFKSRFYLN